MRNFQLLLLIVCFHMATKAQAQPVYQGQVATGLESPGPNWKVFTNGKSRETLVQFFAKDQTLLYEEEIPEKWIKQNKRNRRRLDRLLADINANKLVISKLNTEELPFEKARRAISNQLEDTSPSSERNNPYKIHVTINADGKIRVAVNNPENLKYKIEIADYSGKIVYQEFTSLSQYRRHIDISPVVSLAAQLIFSIDKRRLVYNIAREEQKSNYSIKPEMAHL